MKKSALENKLILGGSLEATGRDEATIRGAASVIQPEQKISIAYLGNETDEQRVATAGAIRELGFWPVPHISARRTKSAEALESYLAGLQKVGANDRLIIIGGDPKDPEGPYSDALSIIKSGIPKKYGVKDIGIAGYPEGHPDISNDVLWQALADKAAALTANGYTGRICTQFSFDAEAVVKWIREVRARGIELPVRVGVPGPAGIKRLLGYATRFGVGTNAFIIKKYGLSLTNLMGTAGPDNFIRDLAKALESDPSLGAVDLHYYTFGGIDTTAKWVQSSTAGK